MSKSSDTAVYLNSGFQLIDSTNISFSKCQFNAAYALLNSQEHSTPKLNYSSINNATSEQCVMFHATNSHLITLCNIIKNMHIYKQNSNSYGIVYCSLESSLEVELCHFAFNTGSYLFYNNGDQFNVKNCSIDDSNCVTDLNQGFNQNDIITTKFLNLKLKHISTQKCKIKLDMTTEIFYSHTHVLYEIFMQWIS